MKYALTKKQAQDLITSNLSHYFGVTPEDATYEQFYKAVAMIVREMMRNGRKEFEDVADRSDASGECSGACQSVRQFWSDAWSG